MSEQKAWTPDQKLRADATDLQISQRYVELRGDHSLGHDGPAVIIAREYAAACTQALDGITYLTLTQGHPEFGIECTMARGDDDVTVINQPSPIAAILNARAQLDLPLKERDIQEPVPLDTAMLDFLERTQRKAWSGPGLRAKILKAMQEEGRDA